MVAVGLGFLLLLRAEILDGGDGVVDVPPEAVRVAPQDAERLGEGGDLLRVPLLEEVLLGKSSSKAALDGAADEITGAIDKYNKSTR